MAAGLLAAWIVGSVLDGFHSGWLMTGAAVCLGGALVLHQRSAQLDKGRRWRKTA